MNTNLFMFFVFATLCAAILDSVMGGTTGMSTTNLTANLSATGTTANVQNAEFFEPAPAVVTIGDEIMCYQGKTDTTLTGLIRGARCADNARVTSDVTEHLSGRRVYSEAPGMLNDIIGFDIASNFSEGGPFGALKGAVSTIRLAPEFIAVLARMIMWDFSFLTGPYVYVRYLILGALSGGLVLGGIKLVLGR
jgi:hypothetical protein|tara:strand:- start:292 stop:870 length:579 start_codon:yes stop_codon:yes gene_type:complete